MLSLSMVGKERQRGWLTERPSVNSRTNAFVSNKLTGASQVQYGLKTNIYVRGPDKYTANCYDSLDKSTRMNIVAKNVPSLMTCVQIVGPASQESSYSKFGRATKDTGHRSSPVPPNKKSDDLKPADDSSCISSSKVHSECYRNVRMTKQRCFSAPSCKISNKAAKSAFAHKSSSKLTSGCKGNVSGEKYRCASAPLNKTLNKARQSAEHGSRSSSIPNPECSNTTKSKCRCSSAPVTSSDKALRQNGGGGNNIPPALSSPLYTFEKCTQKPQNCTDNKFSDAVQSEDQGTVSDVMSFPDDFIDHHLDAVSSSDSCLVDDMAWRPQWCLPFRRTAWTDNSRHCCAKFANRPKSSPSLRQRTKPRLKQSHLRRGNVPKYISFVDQMPVHARPGTGTSSGYGSLGYSVVSEDLLVSAGTQPQEEVDGSVEGTGSEIGEGGYRLHGLDEGHKGTIRDDVDAGNKDLEATLSPRSSECKSALSQLSELDAVDSVIDAGGLEFPNDQGGELDMVNDEVDTVEAELSKNSTEIDENALEADEMRHENTSSLTTFSDNSLGESFEIGLTSEVNDFIGNDDGSARDDHGYTVTYEDNSDLSRSPVVVNLRNPASDMANTDFDSHLPTSEDLTNKENVPDNNPQVTFAEPLTRDRGSSANVDDSENNTNRGQPKSILKGIGSGNGKTKVYELEVEPSVMKRIISPVLETKDMPAKPVFERRQANLRPQNRPSIVPDHDRIRTSKSHEDEEAEEMDESDHEMVIDSCGNKSRRSKPKNSIYSKRANLKPPSEKLQKRKESIGDIPDEDMIVSAESTLLMEQILEQEKRLKEGMKPWLKGRLALSQQNSRFEIPMDVRLLETMSPLDYLSNYCVISKRRKALYKHVFQKVDRNRDGAINFTELEKGLKDVHTGVLDSKHLENIIQLVNIDKESEFDLKQFSGVAAFSERLSCKDQLPVELLNNLDGQKEVIESADFFALSWKLDGIHVNTAVKKILDSL